MNVDSRKKKPGTKKKLKIAEKSVYQRLPIEYPQIAESRRNTFFCSPWRNLRAYVRFKTQIYSSLADWMDKIARKITKCVDNKYRTTTIKNGIHILIQFSSN